MACVIALVTTGFSLCPYVIMSNKNITLAQATTRFDQRIEANRLMHEDHQQRYSKTIANHKATIGTLSRERLEAMQTKRVAEKAMVCMNQASTHPLFVSSFLTPLTGHAA